MTPKYELRYFFDPGSGICLWSRNDSAKERFGYPVELWQLPLTPNTQRWLRYLLAWFDTSVDWNNHQDADKQTWSEEEWDRFQLATQKGLRLIRQDLPESEYQVFDESGF